MKNKAAITKILNTLDSVLKCINTVRTRYDFIDAIVIVVAIVMPLRLIPATATVIAVRVKSPSQTRIYLL
jgi:hypothetical protein